MRFPIALLQRIDPLARPPVTASSDHYFSSWCLYIRPSPFFNISQKELKRKEWIATGGTAVGLAKWIIDYTLFCNICFHAFKARCS